jgi:monovalent cation:H+ antiporter-2, CPA2 family
MELVLLKDILLIFGFSIFVILVCHRFHIPPVVGFLLTGCLSGPHGLGIVKNVEDVDLLAQIGIMLLMFGIGMEFSIKKLVQMKRLFLLGGSLQVGLTVLFSFIIAKCTGCVWGEALFIGFLISMSSTAVVLRLLEQKGESSSPHGRLSIAILIFQDMVAIPMILVTPLLSVGKGSEGFDPSLLWQLGKGLVILAFVFVAAEKFVPRIVHMIARTRNKELFLLTVLALCFGVAWLTSSLGLSLTIGAFLAGLIISESDFSNEAISNIFPFQALFLSFFFVSIGMLLDLDFVLHQPFKIVLIAAAILLLKTITGSLTTLLLGLPLRTAMMTGIALCQIGEFSFVLAKTGIPYGLVTDAEYQLFLAVSLLTLAISPVLINLSPRIASLLSYLPLPERIITGIKTTAHKEEELTNHVIIIGFGISGKNLARSSKLAGVPYTILEMNPDTVKEQKKLGEPIHFGDATHMMVLHHLNIHKAKAVAVLTNDPIASRRIVQIAREANPSVYLIVRTRYIQEMKLMHHLGADEVIPDEYGTSVEIFSRVLRQYQIPDEEINNFITQIRSDGYELLRNNENIPPKLSELKLNLSNVEVGSFRMHPSSPLIGKMLSESGLRNQYGISVLMIRRENTTVSNPAPDTQFFANDVVVVVGEKIPLDSATKLFGATT